MTNCGWWLTDRWMGGPYWTDHWTDHCPQRGQTTTCLSAVRSVDERMSLAVRSLLPSIDAKHSELSDSPGPVVAAADKRFAIALFQPLVNLSLMARKNERHSYKSSRGNKQNKAANSCFDQTWIHVSRMLLRQESFQSKLPNETL